MGFVQKLHCLYQIAGVLLLQFVLERAVAIVTFNPV